MTKNLLTRRKALSLAAATGVSSIAAPSILFGQSQPLRIGVAAPTSGVYSSIGNERLAGVKLAVYQANKDGGLLGRQIELVVRDDKGTGAAAIAAAREFAGMGINLQIGGVFTPSTLAVLPLLEELNSVFVLIGTFTVGVMHENFTPYAFRPCANNYIAARGLARSVLERYKGVSRWRCVVHDNAYGRDNDVIFTAGLKDFYASLNSGKQPEILPPLLVSPQQTDFQSQINQLRSAGVEGVFLAIPGAGTNAFHQQSKQVGFDKTYKVVVDTTSDSIAKQLGQNTPDNLWVSTYWPYRSEPIQSNKVSQRNLEDYTAMTGDKFPSGVVLSGHRSAQCLFAGIKKANSTETKAVIAGMEQATYESLGVPQTMRKEDHQGLGTSYFGRAVAMDKEPFWNMTDIVAVADATIVEPPSPGKTFTP